MNILGIRCSSSDYTFAVISGMKTSPTIIVTKTIAYPKLYRLGESIKWFFLEIETLLNSYHIEKIVIKGYEGRFRGKPITYDRRIEHEAIIFLVAENHGIKEIFKKVKSTIAKDLGLKDRGKYLKTNLDTSVIPNFCSYNDKTKESIQAAWSELP